MLTIEYHGIRPDDPKGRSGLSNPERGWRLETVIAEPPGIRKDMGVHCYAAHLNGRIFPGYNDHWWMLDAERYKPFGLTMVQMYCYLDDFTDTPISDEKLALLEQSLNRLRRLGLKTLLRFAYEKSGNSPVGPTINRILSHLDQLAPIIRGHQDVIYVMQAGFVGAYGEWHSSKNKTENDHGALAALMARILDILPPDRMTQVRVPKYKRWALGVENLADIQVVDAGTAYKNLPFARIGFHNDGFLARNTCGSTWKEPPFFSSPGNPEFDYMTRESPYVPVDGELFWRDQSGYVDGFAAICRMRLHHYGTFSLWHSYSGREGKRYAIDEWMRRPLVTDQARAEKLPMSNGYFQDATDAAVARTQFEYITDHLGYRFELQRAMFPEGLHRGEPFSVRMEIINRGFAVPHNPRPVIIALIDSEGQVTEFLCPNADPRGWQPFDPADDAYKPLTHVVEVQASLPQSVKPGWYQVGLWLPDAAARLRLDPRYAMRMANRDTPWWCDDAGHYGVNILGVLAMI